jgi:hypothetical protein
LAKAPAIFVTLAASLAAAPSYAEPVDVAIAARGVPVKGKRANRVVDLLRDAAAERSELRLFDAAKERRLFATPAPRDPRKAVERATKIVERGQESLRNFDLADAEQKLARAFRILKPYLGLPEALEADTKRLYLGVALAHAQRNETAMTNLLLEYATRYPDRPPSDAGWPPDVMERLDSVKRLPQSSIVVRSEPSAETFVDGTARGPTPRTVSPVPAGRHRVALEAPGYYRATKWVDAQAAKSVDVTIPLAPDLGDRLAKDDEDAPSAETVAAVGRIARERNIGAVLLVHPQKDNRMRVSFVSTGERPRVTAAFEVAASKDGAKTAMSQIALHLKTLEAKRPDVPIWAWVGAGAGLAAVGTGVALRMVALGTQDEFERRAGTVTQADAFDLRDRAESQARGGAVLLGAGVATIVGVASWVALDWIEGE